MIYNVGDMVWNITARDVCEVTGRNWRNYVYKGQDINLYSLKSLKGCQTYYSVDPNEIALIKCREMPKYKVGDAVVDKLGLFEDGTIKDIFYGNIGYVYKIYSYVVYDYFYRNQNQIELYTKSEFKYKVGDKVYWKLHSCSGEVLTIESHRSSKLWGILYNVSSYGKYLENNGVKIAAREEDLELVETKYLDTWLEEASKAIRKAGGDIPVERLKQMTMEEFSDKCGRNDLHLVYGKKVGESDTKFQLGDKVSCPSAFFYEGNVVAINLDDIGRVSYDIKNSKAVKYIRNVSGNLLERIDNV